MNTPENENSMGRALVFTPKQEKVRQLILDFMDDNGEGGCPAFSPDFLFENLHANFKKQDLRVGLKTLKNLLEASPEVHYDYTVTGTVFRIQIAKEITYNFVPNNPANVVSAKIGNKVITNGEGSLTNVSLGLNETLPVSIHYNGLVEWKLTINNIKISDTYELELINIHNEDPTGISVIDNSIITVKGVNKPYKEYNTIRK